MKTNHRARPYFRTAVSALALALGLSACAGGSSKNSPASQVEKDKSTLLLRIADETAAGGDPATAIGLYRQLHQASPRDPVPLTRLAVVLAGMREYRAAADAYRAAVALDANNADLHRGLAATLLASGDAEGSLAELRNALSKRPDDPRLYNLLGVAQDMSGRHDLAQQTYQHGLDLAPANLGLRNNYAMSLALSGDFSDAVAKLAEIAGPAAPPRYRLNLALAYGLAGDEAKAAATAREVLDEASVKSNLDHYALLRGMDEDRRTAAIFGAELGAGIPVADASAKPRNTAVAEARPAPAPATPVEASNLPPLLPTEGAYSAPHHVAWLADRPADRAKDKAAPQVASDTPATTDVPKPLAAAQPKPVVKSAAEPKPVAPTAEAPKPTASAAEEPKPIVEASVVPKPVVPAAEAPKPIAVEMPTEPMPIAFTAEPPKPLDLIPEEPKQLAKASAEPKPVSLTSDEATSPPLSLVPPQMSAAQKESAVADRPVPAPLEPADAPSAPSSLPASHSELASPLSGGSIATPVASPFDTQPPAAHDAADLPPDTVALLHQFLDTVMAPAAASPIKPPAASAKPEPAAVKPGATPRRSVERFTVQLGSFQTEETARRFADGFAAKGIVVAISRANDRDGNEWYVIRSGEFATNEDANVLVTMIQSMGGAPVVIRHRIPDTTPAI